MQVDQQCCHLRGKTGQGEPDCCLHFEVWCCCSQSIWQIDDFRLIAGKTKAIANQERKMESQKRWKYVLETLSLWQCRWRWLGRQNQKIWIDENDYCQKRKEKKITIIAIIMITLISCRTIAKFQRRRRRRTPGDATSEVCPRRPGFDFEPWFKEEKKKSYKLDFKKKRRKVTNSKFITQIQIVAECVSEKRVLLSLWYLWLVSPDAPYPKSPRSFSSLLTVFDSSLLLCFAVLGLKIGQGTLENAS